MRIFVENEGYGQVASLHVCQVSLGRAAELRQTPVEQFMEFAGRHDAPLHYRLDELEEDRRTLERLGL